MKYWRKKKQIVHNYDWIFCLSWITIPFDYVPLLFPANIYLLDAFHPESKLAINIIQLFIPDWICGSSCWIPALTSLAIRMRV